MLQVKLGPRPWHERWERQELKGVQDLGLPDRFYIRAEQLSKPWEKYDMMKKYRSSITDEESEGVMSEVFEDMAKIEKKKGQRRMVSAKPGAK